MTHPTEGEIWKMWETDEGSMSLSYWLLVSSDILACCWMGMG